MDSTIILDTKRNLIKTTLINRFLVAIAASCLVFHPVIAHRLTPCCLSMIPLTGIYTKTRIGSGKKQTPKPVVHAGSLTPKTTELSSEQNPTFASTHLLTIDLAFAFPARPPIGDVAFAFPTRPSIGDLAFRFGPSMTVLALDNALL
jgi:hypothetical protein